jgi:hypothetical protein
MNKSKNTLIILLVIVILGLLGYWYFTKGGAGIQTQLTQNGATPTPAAENTTDLNSLNQELDNTNLNQIDTGLNQLSSESSGF